ncbi:hypothetical protein D9Q98_000255 [Chlorella vulgaris]|uniref:Ion transport domain-containing protein n=1 Tax=Chlorella vulgaris TaxID=3077 RepID=A0A9D4TXX9_CHLVU|nr:hypothetical protein D9Q98_000255 [Chlorella vulgaris]
MGFVDDERAAAAAAQLADVPVEILPPQPGSTLQCSGLDFKYYKLLARRARRHTICGVPVISPFSRLAYVWAAITAVTDMTYTAFIVALSVGFNHAREVQDFSWLGIADLIGSSIYVLDIFAGFHIGFVANWGARAIVVLDARTVAGYYIRTGTFVVDCIATIPSVIQLAVLFTDYDGHLLRMLYTLRLLRLIRVIHLLSNLSPGSTSGPMRPFVSLLSPRMLLLSTALFSLLVLVNLLACLWWNLALDEGLSNSWAAYVRDKDYDLLEAADTQRWLVCAYFALTTMGTIGYGDITPVTFSETGLVLVFEVVGVVFFGYLLNQVAAVLAAAGPSGRRQEAIKNKLQHVEEQMHGLELPAWLKTQVRAFYAFGWMPETNHEARCQFYQELPPKLRIRLLEQRQAAALAHLNFFPSSLQPNQLKAASHALAAASVPILLGPGEQLTDAVARSQLAEESESVGPFCFILEEGEMRALHKGDQVHPGRHLAFHSKVDFSGPAVIGLAALFSLASCRQGNQVDRENLNSGDASPRGCSDNDGECSSSDSSATGSAALAGMPSSWQQRAVALTDCHLWRVDCRHLFAALRDRQPNVLLYWVRRLLNSMGQQPSSTAAAQAAAQAQSQTQTLPHSQLSDRQAMAEQLLSMAAELEAAVAAAEKQQQLLPGDNGQGLTKSSLATYTTVSSWRVNAAQTAELAAVAVEPDAPGLTADVWHNN